MKEVSTAAAKQRRNFSQPETVTIAVHRSRVRGSVRRLNSEQRTTRHPGPREQRDSVHRAFPRTARS